MQQSFTPEALRAQRKSAGLTQEVAAVRLGVSQAYIALLEKGRRRVTGDLAGKIAALYRMGPLGLPLRGDRLSGWDSRALAAELASLGYPGFPGRARRPHENPATILVAGIASDDLETRVLEAFPWLVGRYHTMNWDWVIREAKLLDIQNRLGFVVTLARQSAEERTGNPVVERLRAIEQVLDRARLVREDTLCKHSLSGAERQWLRENRPIEAVHWNLLTDLKAKDLPYAV